MQSQQTTVMTIPWSLALTAVLISSWGGAVSSIAAPTIPPSGDCCRALKSEPAKGHDHRACDGLGRNAFSVVLSRRVSLINFEIQGYHSYGGSTQCSERYSAAAGAVCIWNASRDERHGF